jgi:hypothetical protein
VTLSLIRIKFKLFPSILRRYCLTFIDVAFYKKWLISLVQVCKDFEQKRACQQEFLKGPYWTSKLWVVIRSR